MSTLLAEARHHLAGRRFQAAGQVLAAAYTALGRTDHTDNLDMPDPQLLVTVPLIGVAVGLAVAALPGAVNPLRVGPRR